VILFESLSITGDIPLFKNGKARQKNILLDHVHEEIKEICIKFQQDSKASDMEVKTLLRELARVLGKEN